MVKKAYKEYVKVAFVGDQHIPFEDRNAIAISNAILKDFKPDKVYLLGDVMDFYAVSKFDKDPTRVSSLQGELIQGNLYLKSLRKAVGKDTEIIYLRGNHEDRLRKYLWRHPELYGLQNLKIEKLLDFKELNIKVAKNYEIDLMGFLITHGDMVRKYSGYTAKGLVENKGVSGICGHTHRLAAYHKTDYKGIKSFYENGCLCSLEPTYMNGIPNWQQGFHIGYIKENDYQLVPIKIEKGKALFNGVEYYIAKDVKKKRKFK